MAVARQRKKGDGDGDSDGGGAVPNGSGKKGGNAGLGSRSLWLAACPSKRWGEIFFLGYSPVWIVLCLGIIVPLRIYESFNELEYFLLGLFVALPCFLVPVFVVGKEDGKLRWYDRYWTKANVWIAIFGYVGNYFWTHYFYTVLGATYTFPSWKLNHVPYTTFFLTHAYFLFYHMVSNFTLRRLRHALKGSNRFLNWGCQALLIFSLSYLTAFMEAITISNFPYYDIADRDAFYRVGSLFYAIYFFVSFPMFIRLDEDPRCRWTLSQTAIDSLAAAMLVTIVLDLWRIGLGPIVQVQSPCASYGLPWLS